ncbi:30S ribosomal protein S5 [Diplonema papillatum]|nr:30S ribosomal protein S5 [Diplonema papillatum]
MAFRETSCLLIGGGLPFKWGTNASTAFGYGTPLHNPMQSRKRAQHNVRGWTGTTKVGRSWKQNYWRAGLPEHSVIRKLQWGDFADKLPTSVYFQPGAINGTDPTEQALITKPLAPEFAGSYEAKPWVTPEVFPDNHPLSRMPAPVRNVAAQAERNKNFWSKPDWYTMAEGEILTPFEILECDVRRVGLWMKGGRFWTIMVTVVVANGNGVAGLGVGEARNYDAARQLGIKNAFGNLIAIDPDMDTVPHPIYTEFYRTRVQIQPARSLMASPFISDVLSGIGLRGASVQLKKWKHKKYKKLMTLFSALRSVRSPKVIAQQRGMSLSTVKRPLFTYYEHIRRKRGMFELSPLGKTGFLPPNRVIDNRLPDHLKQKYFSGTEDEKNARIVASPTFRLDAGTERYGTSLLLYLCTETSHAEHSH